MKKIRQIRRYGNSYAIKLEPTDLADMDWEEGDNIDITDCIKVKGDKNGEEE